MSVRTVLPTARECVRTPRDHTAALAPKVGFASPKTSDLAKVRSWKVCTWQFYYTTERMNENLHPIKLDWVDDKEIDKGRGEQMSYSIAVGKM